MVTVVDFYMFVMLPAVAKYCTWCQDTSNPGSSDPRHFGTIRLVSHGHFGTGTVLSWPPANIFAAIGRTEERFNITRLASVAQCRSVFLGAKCP